MIKAIFFATFDVNEGPKLQHLLPPSPLISNPPPLFDFRSLSSLLIPPPQLCSVPINLLTPRARPYLDAHRILSYPICIEHESYPRNAFTFNFGLVLEADTEFSSYLPIIKKLSSLFRTLEEQDGFLTKDIAGLHQPSTSQPLAHDPRALPEDSFENGNGISKSRLYAILEILLSDLNSYGEIQLPVTASTTLNLKIFPTYPSPPPLHNWQVPLLIVSPSTLSSRWQDGDRSHDHFPSHEEPGTQPLPEIEDLTLAHILPHLIPGTNSVQRIALLADADVKLVRKAIKHLLYYRCAILLDIFSFSGAIYAPTSTFSDFVEDQDMQRECLEYIRLASPGLPYSSRGNMALSDTKGRRREEAELTQDRLIQLYASFSQGLSVKAWCLEYLVPLSPSSDAPMKDREAAMGPSLIEQIDVRRMITFGVIRGFLHRVHKYAFLHSGGVTGGAGGSRKKREKTTITAQLGGGDDEVDREEEKLKRFLDGTHPFDEICTEMGWSERKLLARLKEIGSGRAGTGPGAEVSIICR